VPRPPVNLSSCTNVSGSVYSREWKVAKTRRPPTLKSLDKLIDLYEAWNKPEKAEEWRAKLPQTETISK